MPARINKKAYVIEDVDTTFVYVDRYKHITITNAFSGKSTILNSIKNVDDFLYTLIKYRDEIIESGKNLTSRYEHYSVEGSDVVEYIQHVGTKVLRFNTCSVLFPIVYNNSVSCIINTQVYNTDNIIRFLDSGIAEGAIVLSIEPPDSGLDALIEILKELKNDVDD